MGLAATALTALAVGVVGVSFVLPGLATLMGVVTGATALMSTGFRLLWTAITGPFAPLVALIALGTALIIANWDSVKKALMAVWEFIRTAFIPIWQAIVDGWNNGLKPALLDLWNALKSLFRVGGEAAESGEGFAAALATIREVALAVGRVIGQYLRGVIDTLGGAIRVVAGILTGDFALAWLGIRQIAVGALRGIIAVYNETIARLPGVMEIDMAPG